MCWFIPLSFVLLILSYAVTVQLAQAFGELWLWAMVQRGNTTT